ncbi:hypothetical protein NP590_06875 [Methylomonas sp. SURF-2]|uniref:Uncharacterized protein n=1 Tax=Methylomonas subterranea TaxID=2952225 RepID=A0ABT1TED3_9GAMM|nr:hypothetical protein [Methylomonas sp. SURF-2]MCQ8103821.1 hypothetical protein [Methylomonas sp. SURF-2]
MATFSGGMNLLALGNGGMGWMKDFPVGILISVYQYHNYPAINTKPVKTAGGDERYVMTCMPATALCGLFVASQSGVAGYLI